MSKNCMFFFVFSSDPGGAGVTPTPPVLYQIRQNPYSQRTVWEKDKQCNKSTTTLVPTKTFRHTKAFIHSVL